jgi:hypothetical protein
VRTLGVPLRVSCCLLLTAYDKLTSRLHREEGSAMGERIINNSIDSKIEKLWLVTL